MSSLRMVEASLPPGFRFHPRDDELVCDYLLKKWTGAASQSPLLTDVDLNKSEPWDIPALQVSPATRQGPPAWWSKAGAMPSGGVAVACLCCRVVDVLFCYVVKSQVFQAFSVFL
ncbi:hypothetical protein KSS87_019876 [Heliosperma pusillum]|nr:hypothetical protein KSS87_019876 [Heliosperma pusillum]